MTRVFVERQLLPGMPCCELAGRTVRLVWPPQRERERFPAIPSDFKPD
jgi:hypothetical protein